HGLRARGARLPRPRRRADGRCPEGRGCYGRAVMSDDGEDINGRFDDDDDDEQRSETVVTIEITGLQLFTHHGVTEAEREVGQRLVLDLRLDVGESDATVTDLV